MKPLAKRSHPVRDHVCYPCKDYAECQDAIRNDQEIVCIRDHSFEDRDNGAQEWPDQLCACGCLQYTHRAKATSTNRGHVKGRPVLFLPYHKNKPETRWPDQLCECGRGRYTARAKKTDRGQGRIRGKPNRYIDGHFQPRRPKRENQWPDQLCECGCGQITERAAQSIPSRGYVRGKPNRFLAGHWHRDIGKPTPEERWPDQLCACGCGQVTKRATKTDKACGAIRGKPNRFIRYHWDPNV